MLLLGSHYFWQMVTFGISTVTCFTSHPQLGVIPRQSTKQTFITFSCVTQASICLCNIAHHGAEYLKNVLDAGAMNAFINIIKSPDQDTIVTGLQFIEMALRNFPASKELFEVGEGIACLEALEYSCNETVAQYANELLDTYFMEEEADDGDGDGRDENDGGGASSWRYQDSEMTTWPNMRE